MAVELENIRIQCNKIHKNRRDTVKQMLILWLEKQFIYEHHRPWKAVLGNKRFRPVPIHRDFSSDKIRNLNCVTNPSLYWPELPDEEILSIIKDLGFKICSVNTELDDNNKSVVLDELCLYVLPPEEGKPLTFAQEWVRKINNAYSKYVREERKIAKQHYFEVLSDLNGLCSNDYADYIRFGDDCVIIENYDYSEYMSKICRAHVTRLLAKDGITYHCNEDKNLPEVHVALSLNN